MANAMVMTKLWTVHVTYDYTTAAVDVVGSTVDAAIEHAREVVKQFKTTPNYHSRRMQQLTGTEGEPTVVTQVVYVKDVWVYANG